MNTEAKTKPKRSVLANLIKYAIPLIISIGLCYLLFTGIDFKEMIEIVKRDCDFRWIAAMLGMSLFSYLFRALRWRIQLEALGIRVPVFYVVLSTFGTYAVNLVFPRLGEVWRSGYIAQRQDAPFTAVLGSMVAERLADTVTVAAIALLSFVLASGAITSYLSGNATTIESIKHLLLSPWVWGTVVLTVIAICWLLRSKTDNTSINKIQKAFKGLWQGFTVIATMPGKGQWLLWTACLWGCYYTQLLIAFLAFPSTAGVLQHYGLTASLVTFALSSLSMGVPSNGGIGPWQWAVIFALGIYGIDNANSGAFANVVLGSQTLLQIVLGIFTFAMIALDRRQSKTVSDAKINLSENKQKQNTGKCQKS